MFAGLFTEPFCIEGSRVLLKEQEIRFFVDKMMWPMGGRHDVWLLAPIKDKVVLLRSKDLLV